MKPISHALPLLCLAVGFSACLFSKGESTESIPVVPGVNIERYIGKWYEIARITQSFEKDLVNVTATYTPKPDGKIEVRNEGYVLTASGKKKTAIGKAWIPDTSVTGSLKVSFFLFFGAGYRIIDLDTEGYQYAVITSNTKDYLWILSRTPQMDAALFDSLMEKLKAWGFDMKAIVKVPQEWNS